MSNPKKQANGSKLLSWKRNNQAVLPVSYRDVQCEPLVDAINAVASAGGAIMFGRTSDQGAFSVLVLIDNEKAKEYPHSATEFDELMQEIKAQFVAD